MRNEQIIATVTRTLVIRTVREIETVRLFVRTVDFHLSYLRMGMYALAMAAHARYRSWSSLDDVSSGIDQGMLFTAHSLNVNWAFNGRSGSKHGNLLCQPALVPASCPARFNRV